MYIKFKQGMFSLTLLVVYTELLEHMIDIPNFPFVARQATSSPTKQALPLLFL